MWLTKHARDVVNVGCTPWESRGVRAGFCGTQGVCGGRDYDSVPGYSILVALINEVDNSIAERWHFAETGFFSIVANRSYGAEIVYLVVATE